MKVEKTGIFLGNQIGYNNGIYIVNGIREIINIEVNNKLLIRTQNTYSQARKKRFTRLENLMNSFRLKQTNQLQNKHILLVDDLVTTGENLEYPPKKLLEINGVKVSAIIITVA